MSPSVKSGNLEAKLYLISDVNGVHVAVGCCPRNGDLTSPSRHKGVARVYGLEENVFNGNRQKYAFYLNYFMVEGMVRGDGKLPITCPRCRNTYELKEKHLNLLLDEKIPDEYKVIKKAD